MGRLNQMEFIQNLCFWYFFGLSNWSVTESLLIESKNFLNSNFTNEAWNS